MTEVAIQFQRVPHLPFKPSQVRGLEPNALIIRIQPDEGITLRFGGKVPGPRFEIRSVSMDMSTDQPSWRRRQTPTSASCSTP